MGVVVVVAAVLVVAVDVVVFVDVVNVVVDGGPPGGGRSGDAPSMNNSQNSARPHCTKSVARISSGASSPDRCRGASAMHCTCMPSVNFCHAEQRSTVASGELKH